MMRKLEQEILENPLVYGSWIGWRPVRLNLMQLYLKSPTRCQQCLTFDQRPNACSWLVGLKERGRIEPEIGGQASSHG